MGRLITAGMALLALLGANVSTAKPMAEADVPEPLKPWIEWVKHEHSELTCPVRYSDDGRHCVWPGELELLATDSGATFNQSVAVYRRSEVRLPGDRQHWPVNVKVGDEPLVVVERDSAPYVLLAPGRYHIVGEFQWSSVPSSLGIAGRSGIVRYRLNGKEVRFPRIRESSLWLRDGSSVDQSQTPEDRLSMEVYRLVADGHPGTVVTHLAVEVSGKQREVVLGKPLLEQFVPLKVDSQLPARLEPDGSLRVQVRPGRWVFRVHARHPSAFTQLAMRSADQTSSWPQSEVWVYRSSPRDRLTDIEGVRQIDPRQVRLPSDWANLPAYTVTPETPFQIKVTRRGDPEPEPDSLSLSRDLWLDFDGDGFTLRDQISGKMTSGWRLSADDGFALGRVTVDGKPQFITRLADETRNGVEVRRGELNLSAESRFEGDASAIPATGWGRDFQRVSAKLHLPPGYQVLAITGVDNVPASWLQRWTLYDIFLVLIITVGVGRLWGWPWAPVAMVTLGLVWHEPQAPRTIWLYLLAVVALLRVVPPSSNFFSILKNLRLVGLVVLLVMVLPFMVQQAREGIYPQLEKHRWTAPAKTATTVAQQHRNLEGQEAALRSEAKGMASDVISSLATAPYETRGRIGKYAGKPALDQIDPNATIQTGPGLPNWQWRTARLQWNGPVAADQQIGIHLIGPVGHLILNFVMIGLLLLMGWRFLDLTQDGGKWRLNHLLVAVLAGFSGNSSAADFPPPELLKQLEQRLVEPMTTAPRAAIPAMTITLHPDRYEAEFRVHSLQETAIPLPVDVSLTVPVDVKIEGIAVTNPLLRNQANQLWLLVPKGEHRVRLSVYLPPVDQLQIPLPLRPQVVRVAGEGWSVEGIDQHFRPQKQLSLMRVRTDAVADQEELVPSVLPPFLRVERTLHFGIQWQVTTRVTRVSPPGTPVSVQVPVVPGASVVTDGLTVDDGRVLVSMAAGQREVSWRSRLDPVDALTLTAADNSAWVETWRADIGPIWHVRIDGIPPIHHQDSGKNWLPAWHPWPGEQATFAVERPQGVSGNTSTIDRSHLTVKPGKRATDSTLTFRLRSSQGGKRDVTLPEGAELLSVKVDGRTQPVRLEQGRVSLPVIPGEQTYELVWRQMAGINTSWSTPAISLGGDSVNAKVTVHAPKDRWTLWLSGPALGPAVLFWGVLSVLVLVAVVLGRVGSAYLPVGTATWLVLGLGLTQVSVFALVLVAVWFFALHHRSANAATVEDKGAAIFNLVQVGIVLLTIATASVLLGAVQNGLLGDPAMLVRGNQSSSYLFNWYQDRIPSDYAQASVFSVPLWVYRALMMVWALWLAFSLLSWSRWGWQSFSTAGLWKDAQWRQARKAQKADKPLQEAQPNTE